MRRMVFAALAGSLAVVGVAGLGFFVADRPTQLRIAVSTNNDSAKLITALSQAFAREAKNIRLKIVPLAGFAANAAALEAKQVDLAVVRTDISMPPSGQTIAILYREAAILMAPSGSKLTKVSQLRGQRVGVLRGRAGGSGNTNLLATLLEQYDVPAESVTTVPLFADEVLRALRDQEIDALLAIGVPSGGPVGEAVNQMTQIGNGPPVFIPIADAAAIAQRLPAFETQEVVAGSFGGSPPRPEKDLDTLGISVRLVAKNTLADSVAADLARHIFAVRPMIAVTLPLANRLMAPPSDKGVALPTHPGVVAYLDSDELTFFDKNGDIIYLGAMFASLIGSGFAAFASRIGSRSHEEVEQQLARLVELMAAARSAKDAAALDDIESEADAILNNALDRNKLRGLEGHRATAFSMAFERVFQLVQEKRLRLAQNAGSIIMLAPAGRQTEA